MGKKKTSIHSESLFMSFESIMDFSKEIPSLLSLIASLEFNDLLRWNSISNECMKETWEVRRILDSNHIYQVMVMANLVINDEQQFLLFLSANSCGVYMPTQDFHLPQKFVKMCGCSIGLPYFHFIHIRGRRTFQKSLW